MYSAKLLDHFEHPRNAGELPNPAAQVRVTNPACGDILELQVTIEDGRLAQVRFRAQGCVPAMACASAATELLLGRTLDEVRLITRKQVIAAVEGVPPASGHAADLAVDAVRELLKKVDGR